VSHTVSAALGFSSGYYPGVCGLSKMLEKLDATKVDKVLISSSSLTSGLLKDKDGIIKSGETWIDTGESYHAYVSNKLAMELCLRDWHVATGKNFVIMRFATTYGPRMRPGVVDDYFIRRIMKGKPMQIHGDGKQWRQHIYVKDLVKGIVLAVEKDEANNKVLHLVPDYRVSVLDMANAYKKAVPEASIEFVDKRPVDIKVKFLDSKETKKILGWKPEFSLEEGVLETVRWYKEHPDWKPEEMIEDLYTVKGLEK